MVGFAIACALAGAVAGRVAFELRRALEAGEEPSIDPAAIEVRPRDVVPGLLVALRSADWPWSYLHLPAWLVAFGVNFLLGAFGPELAPLRRAAGIDLFERGDDSERPEHQGPGTSGAARAPLWAAEEAPLPDGGGGAAEPADEPPSTLD
jgi:hypothetical protein